MLTYLLLIQSHCWVLLIQSHVATPCSVEATCSLLDRSYCLL
nr:MAG TPA: hypothetical protein [Bacteriophage sp.]